MKMRKFLSVLLAAFMALALVPAAALAEDTNVHIEQTIPAETTLYSPTPVSFKLENISQSEQTITAMIRFQGTNEDHALTLSNFTCGDTPVETREWIVKNGENEASQGPWVNGDRFLGYDVMNLTIPASGSVTINAVASAAAIREYKFKTLTGIDTSTTGTMNVGPLTATVIVHKEWDDAGYENERPESLTIKLMDGETVLGEQTMTPENGVWPDVTFTDVPLDCEIVEFAPGEGEDEELYPITGYVSTVTGPYPNGDGTYTRVLTNSKKKESQPGLEKWIIGEDPIICFGDTFRSGGTFVSIVVGDNEMEDKVLTTKDRFSFEGDHSTDELIASFLANNPDAEGHNEHQWGYKAEVVPGHPHCLRIVPAEPAEGEEAKPHITADECEIVGMGGHDPIFMPLSHKVKHYDAQPGDTITFKLYSNVPDTLGNFINPEYPPEDPEMVGIEAVPPRGEYELVFHDILGDCMTYTDQVTVTIGGREIPAANYTVEYPAIPREGCVTDTPCTFHVIMDLIALYDAGLITDDDIENASPIIVTYTAEVNDDTTHGACPNTAWVTYPDGDTPHDTVYVHVYAIDVYKYDQNNEQTPLPGAEFVLFKDEDKTQIATWEYVSATADKPAYYRFNEWVATPEGNPPEYTDEMILISGADGKIILEGLLPGTYWLKETKAPEGYIMSDVLLEVTITATESTETEAHIVHTQFANSNIPHTGGGGTRLFTLVGSALLIMAAAVLCFRRKKENFA